MGIVACAGTGKTGTGKIGAGRLGAVDCGTGAAAGALGAGLDGTVSPGNFSFGAAATGCDGPLEEDGAGAAGAVGAAGNSVVRADGGVQALSPAGAGIQAFAGCEAPGELGALPLFAGAASELGSAPGGRKFIPGCHGMPSAGLLLGAALPILLSLAAAPTVVFPLPNVGGNGLEIAASVTSIYGDRFESVPMPPYCDPGGDALELVGEPDHPLSRSA
jgi:hypothetical protein